MKPKVGIVILNYQNYEDTVMCINSVKNIVYSNSFIVLVDNNSKDGSEILLKKYAEDQEIVFVESLINLGYAGGNNLGIKKAMELNSEYICILNNDIEVCEDFLNKIIDFMENTPDCAICGPVILDYYQKDLIQSAGAKIVFSNADVSPLYSGCKINEIPSVIDADYISGSCMVISVEKILEIGLIPEDYFLFFEETDWCNRAKRYGYHINCITSTKIWHKGSATIDCKGGLAEYLMERNRLYFIKKNAKIKDKVRCFLYLYLRAAWWGLSKDLHYFKYIKYYTDGLFNKVSNEFPYIIIKR